MSVTRQAERLPLHRIPVDAVLARTGKHFMFSDMTMIQHFIPYARRELEIRVHHSILPGDVLLRNRRVVIVISFPHNLIIQRMIQHLHPQRQQIVIFLLTLGQETHVKVGLADIHRAGFSRIKGFQGLGDVANGVRILQLPAKHHHSMLEGVFFLCRVLSRRQEPGRIASAGQHQGQGK